jgi:hypothetical protein
MTKIQSLRNLEAEMRAVARGDKPAPADAAHPSFESTEAFIQLSARDPKPQEDQD